MQLTIHNVGRIHRADIRMDGLTVIAGPNNTGKSTLGEALFALANSQFDFPSQVLRRNQYEIKKSIRDCLFVRRVHGSEESPSQRFSMNFRAMEEIGDAMANYFVSSDDQVSEKDVLDWLQSFSTQITDDSIESERSLRQSTPRQSIKAIVDILTGSDKPAKNFRETCVRLFSDSESTLRKLFLKNAVNCLFFGQFESIGCSRAESSLVSLGDETKNNVEVMEARFVQNACTEFSTSLTSQPYVLFIDDPNILSMVTLERWPKRRLNFGLTVFAENKSEVFARALQQKMEDKTSVRSADDQKIYDNKCQQIIELLDTAHEGRIARTDNRSIILEEGDKGRQILLNNVSVGVKAIELLKEILKSGALDENTFLVLDEPEIHLHPEWQIIYAQALVEIAKLLGTKVVVTTHSPYFIQAIDVFAEHEWDSSNVHTYTPKDGSSFMVDFFEADDETKSDILDSMAKPFDEMQALALRDKLGKSANDD